ncbi:sulfite exporter TauE/SafE [mine drainage metagenome]|uniref:Sulfite exporter TauE/SafE n=1 Tax=mine drainage metagenome TaxID=410659 RepID=A0A1J5S9F0_9ZZZZ
MDIFSQSSLLHSLAGAFVGLLVGMTGVGGGSLMTPLLILLFGIPPVTAVGTDLLYGSATKLCGTAVHSSGKRVAWPVVGLLASGSVPATMATLWAMKSLGLERHHGQGLVSMILGVILVLTAVSMVGRPYLLRFARAHARPVPSRLRLLLTVLTGLVLGSLVTLTSVGAGALGVTILMLLYPDLPPPRIIGTDIAHAVPLTLAAGMGHWLLGGVDWHLLLSLLMGSIPGVIIGSVLAARVPELVLRLTLAAALVVAGVRLV